MTKFEQTGVNIQRRAIDKDDAKSRFQNSCRICCDRGIRLDCDRCSISHTHDMVCAAFDILAAARAQKTAKVNVVFR